MSACFSKDIPTTPLTSDDHDERLASTSTPARRCCAEPCSAALTDPSPRDQRVVDAAQRKLGNRIRVHAAYPEGDRTDKDEMSWPMSTIPRASGPNPQIDPNFSSAARYYYDEESWPVVRKLARDGPARFSLHMLRALTPRRRRRGDFCVEEALVLPRICCATRARLWGGR